jgi:aquaporin Z
LSQGQSEPSRWSSSVRGAIVVNDVSGGAITHLGVALAIGGTVAMGALFGGPISGASMNPARSLAPALV